MKARTLYFTAPRRVEVREEQLPEPGPGQALVETACSAVSPGTEMLVYRGEFPAGLPVDECFPGMGADFAYPLAYGYAAAGRVAEVGPGVDAAWLGRAVFAFQAHASHFLTDLGALHPLPGGISLQSACLLPNVETAVTLVQDAAPRLGERALVFGQGIVGLLAAALLAEFPLEALVTVDPIAARREASLALGVRASLDPDEAGFRARARELLPAGADLTLELSGSPRALDEAVALTGFAGRVVVGSWYGRKPVALDLGGAFHRSRMRLLSSQVSTIAPELSGRWDKARRLEQAWAALARLRPERWITQRFPLEAAGEAYELIDRRPQQAIQVLLEYA